MRSFDEIFDIAADRKGGAGLLEKGLAKPLSKKKLAAIPDDRWLSGMAKCVFQAGFNWKVVDNKWPGTEAAFDGFHVGRCASLNDEDIDRLLSDTRIIRHGTKIRSIQQNAVFLTDIANEYESAGKMFASWPSEDYIGLLALLKKRGSRLGGNTGQYFLRFMGVDSFVLSRDVIGRLIAEGVIDAAPTSQKSMKAVQQAFNTWRAGSGRSLTEISRVLAMSTG